MADYQLRTTDIAVYPVDKFPLHRNAIRVQLAGDPDGGYFIRLEQEDQAIELDPEELPLILQAARLVLEGGQVTPVKPEFPPSRRVSADLL